jgi:autotransporter-associated beta strand protein
LKTTAIASGYPALDDAEGWGRLNLFAAADGYAVFNGNVVVSMDASKGGFYAVDNWRNDISGAGKLTKQGSGVLKLSGNNTWSGGAQLEAGTLEGDSVSAFGASDVYVSGGTLASNAPGALTIQGKYTQLANSTLELNLGTGQQGTLAVAGNMTIAGGTLHIKFQGGYKPAVGDTISIIAATSLKGKFDTISVDGFSATPLYSNTGLQLRIGA